MSAAGSCPECGAGDGAHDVSCSIGLTAVAGSALVDLGADERGMGIGRVGAAIAAGVEAARDAARAMTDCPECGVGNGAHDIHCSIAAQRRGRLVQGLCPHDGATCHHNCSQNEKGENVTNYLCWREEQGMRLSTADIPIASAVVGDPVNHPGHYGGDVVYETIKVIDAWELGFDLGNCVKYISRAGKKNPNLELEDLLKAEFYLKHRIEKLKEEAPTHESAFKTSLVGEAG